MTTPIPCAFCPTKDGAIPMATARVWLIVSRSGWTLPTARQYALCESCLREAREHGDLVPGAEIVVLL